MKQCAIAYIDCSECDIGNHGNYSANRSSWLNEYRTGDNVCVWCCRGIGRLTRPNCLLLRASCQRKAEL